jgi:calcineurin-like phosphoesterase
MAWEPATDTVTLCAVLVEVDSKTNLAKKIKPIILGDTLENTLKL